MKGENELEVTVVRVRIDRKNNEEISREIIGKEEVDEDLFYKQLVSVYYERIKEE